MIKKSYLIATLIAGVAAAWILSGQIDSSHAPAAGEAALTAVEPPPIRVRVQRLKAEHKAREIVVRGRTEASRHVDLRAQTSGRVERIDAAKGTALEDGGLIVQLALEDRPARLNEAKALVEQRSIEYHAAKTLSEKGYRAETKLAEARAQLDAAAAALARIETDIAHTRVRAPFTGVLEARPVELGDFVEVGDPIGTVVDLDPILVVGSVSERDIAKVSVGTPGRARLVTGEALDGTVRYISAVADTVTRTFRVELEIPNPSLAVKEGTTAELRLPAGTVGAHRVSPAILSLSDAGEIGVKTVNDDNVVEFRPAKIIGDGPDGVWLGGLPATITVITVGQDFVQPGVRVAPVAVAEGAS
jgi:multidrug efflux system membrane fusion protein